ncbi:Gti1/Pac2 family-domain-containing protein [Amanita rubescens]|nr:Gti1/Pac2 family-domain-containing protein [Amanita rubescens]KAF8348781.1 Gti1/Pac2 family-domain-containing protein [Amanita rubescens]
MTSNPDVPPFIGYVETTINALRLIHAARQGVIPRITRRLNDAERRSMIKSGAVFVFSVEESGIKRWTDGLLWSPSRIVGNFLVYREINERTSSRGSHRKPYPNDEASRALVRRNSPDSLSGAYKVQLAGAHGGGDQGTFKPNGLIKKTITVTIEGSDLHLISYYTSEDIRSGKLKRPTSRPDIMALPMPPQIFRLTNFRVPPKVEIGPDGKPRLVCEPEDLEPTECKTEETNYHVSDTSHWSANQIVQPSPVESQYGNNSLYPVAQNQQMVSGLYSRVSHTDRWSLPADNGMRLTNMSRHHHDASWPSNTNAHSIPRRRDNGPLSQTSESWTSLHSQTNRWQSDGHEPTANSLYLDRSRVRSNSAYEASSVVSHRREGDMMAPGLGSRYLNSHVAPAASHRDGALPRLSWLPQESSEMTRDGRHHSSSFTPSPTIPFSHNYHTVQNSYSSTYDSTGTLLSTPTIQSTSPQSDLPPYDTSYASGSGAMSSPEEYTKLEEFGDSKLT